MSIGKNGIWKHSGSPNKNYIKNSDWSNKTSAGLYTFNNDIVTFEATALNQSGNSFACSIDTAGLTDFKNKVLTFSMEYKIDTALTFGTTNPWVGFEMGVSRNTTTGGSNQWLDWYGGKSIPTAVTNGWIKKSFNVTISNYDIASLSISFYLRDTTGKISYRHPKIEIGNTPTAWVLNESDINYVQNNHGFIENTTVAKIQQNDYIEANNFIEI